MWQIGTRSCRLPLHRRGDEEEVQEVIASLNEDASVDAVAQLVGIFKATFLLGVNAAAASVMVCFERAKQKEL